MLIVKISVISISVFLYWGQVFLKSYCYILLMQFWTISTMIFKIIFLGGPSRLNYCNTSYRELPLKTTQNLQLIQNAEAWAVTDMQWYACVIPLLCELHWLPVCFRVRFNVMVITYEALHRTGSDYLRDRLPLVVTV